MEAAPQQILQITIMIKHHHVGFNFDGKDFTLSMDPSKNVFASRKLYRCSDPSNREHTEFFGEHGMGDGVLSQKYPIGAMDQA